MPRFRLLAGKHAELVPAYDEEGEPKKNPDGSPQTDTKVYNRGDVFDSPSDLRFLNSPGSIKFEAVDDEADARAERLRRGRGRGAPQVDQPEVSAGGPDPNLPDVPPVSSVAPGGQVSSGFQQAAGTPGGTVSGPVRADQSLAEQARRGGTVGKTGRDAGQPATTRTPARPARVKTAEELDAMTLKDLHDYAADEEIDLKGATHKADVVKAIQQQQKAQK